MENSYYYTIDDETELKVFPCGRDGFNRMMNEISGIICFSDCTDEEIFGITGMGKPLYYAGWRPGMEFTYLDESGEEIWTGYFPSWDH